MTLHRMFGDTLAVALLALACPALAIAGGGGTANDGHGLQSNGGTANDGHGLQSDGGTANDGHGLQSYGEETIAYEVQFNGVRYLYVIDSEGHHRVETVRVSDAP